MSENNKNVFEELREIAENTLRVYQSGLIQEDKRQGNENTRIDNENTRIDSESTRIDNENTRIDNENTRIDNENERIRKDEIRDIKISKIEYLIGDVEKTVDGILTIQRSLIGGDL